MSDSVKNTNSEYHVFLEKLRLHAQFMSYTNKYDQSNSNEYKDTLSIGRISEVGEIADKIKKRQRDGTDLLKADFNESLVKELGDVCWYVGAEIIHGEQFLHLMNSNYLTVKEQSQSNALSRMCYENLYYVTVYLFDVITYDMLECMSELEPENRVNHVLRLNFLKLAKRYAENKIGGSGDNR